MTGVSEDRPGKLQTVQALRGLAAFLVLIFHVASVQKDHLPGQNLAEQTILSGFWDQGFMGVDMFFVISGFIMVYVTHHHSRSVHAAARFLYARITRIYPLWWVFAAIMMVYFWLAYGQIAPPDKISEAKDVLPFSVKSMLLLPQTHHPVLGLGWTLIHEMFFYLVFTGFLLFSRRWFGLLLGGWAIFVLLATLVTPAPAHAYGFVSLATSPLTLEFILGAFAALLVLRKVSIAPKWVAGMSAIVLLVLIFSGIGTAFTLIWNRVLLYTGPCVGLIYGLSLLEREGRIDVPRWMVALGDWSYSLYLSHLIVLLALRRIWKMVSAYMPDTMARSFGYYAPGFWDNLAFAVVGIVLCLAFAATCYRFIERPLIGFFRRRKAA